MDTILNDYLERIEKHLKPLPASERVDIVQEIKSEILDLQNDGKTAEEIVERLGSPKELAKAYLGDLISRDSSFSWNRVLAICAFYSLTSLSGLIVIPTLAICAPTFLLCAILTPILGAVKLLDSLLNLGLPYVNYIGVIGVHSPTAVFLLCLLVGIVLFLVGYGCWKLLVRYIHAVSQTKNRLSI